MVSCRFSQQNQSNEYPIPSPEASHRVQRLFFADSRVRPSGRAKAEPQPLNGAHPFSKMDDLGVPPSHIYIYTYIFIYLFIYLFIYTHIDAHICIIIIIIISSSITIIIYICGLYMVMGQNPNPDRTLSHMFGFSWSFFWMVIPPVIW